jgi:hypothetical protein
VISMGIEPVTFQLIAQWLIQLYHCVPCCWWNVL